ncbi:zygote arrest protein 1 [Mytilus galloprovincialis]|uniref:Zygote arrest protein 1 n=1 Tax=Mytilus galloprovincialis TaxID=29158 RepID=A0A8B6FTI4_MYTGA|nr:zygote arrest protein 1 [Mytilus galloprovincialis]
MPRTERRYGFFRCPICRAHWESAYVFCVQGTDRVYYKQDCKKCKKACNPYRLEKLKCSICGQSDCTCSKEEKEERHTDPNKPHRSDLCHKCQSGRPCMRK